jgi:glycolate dehydrogenase FAD-binding subunit
MTFEIDGLSPHSIEIPKTIDDLARIVACASKENSAIIAWGGGTMQHLGGIPRRYDIALQTTRLDRIVEYSPDDLTITVEAGITLAQLQAELATHNQFIALDPPLPAQSTIGGILATDSSGPSRLRYGTARDFTLGMRVVNAEGKITKSGGKVVKNVAGYELPKLYIGSLGGLGVIAEVTFKIFPKPPEETTLTAAFASHHAASQAVRGLWSLTTSPQAIELLDTETTRAIGLDAETNSYVVAARFAGTRKIIDTASLKATSVAQNHDAISVNMSTDRSLWQRISDLPANLRSAHSTGTILRIGLPPSQLSTAIDKITDRAGAVGIESFQLYAHAATAIIYMALDAEPSRTVEAIKHLRWALAPLGAHVIVERCSPSVKQAITVWGEPGPEHFLNQRLKGQFDPQLILNPGRNIGGL